VAQLSRRDALKLGLLGAGAVLLPAGELLRAGADSQQERQPTSPLVLPFQVPLRIPPVAIPSRRFADHDEYVITQQVAQAQILPGKTTTIWGYNGVSPGPTIMAHRDRPLVVHHVNRVGVPTTTHTHGLDVEARSDGHALDLVQPGSERQHNFPNIQPSATLWYHDHAIDNTGRNVYMGLSGFYLITDDHEQSLPLPKGRFDIPLCVQDRLFSPDGSLFYPVHNANLPERQGVFGDVILVNGTPYPVLKVARRRYRFRILNGSDARAYQWRLSTGDPFQVISTDGGLLPSPVTTSDLFHMPAERYDIVVDFAKYPVGAQVVLQNIYAPDPFGDPVDPKRTNQIMRFDVVEDATDPSSVPTDLSVLPDLRLSDVVQTRTFRFERSGGKWVINGLPFDPNSYCATPKYGTTEIWEFVNKSGGWVHPAHVHLVEFLILDRNGQPPKPYERGPKDVTFLGPNETVRVIMKFEHFTGRYMFHCHNLQHEDHDMMTQFLVVP
jgi:spore coat protein A